jgi:polysaccharide transporter, PST family
MAANVYFEDNKAGVGHGRQSLRGGAISILARAINGVVQVGSVLFLARLLSPEDYGLVSMVTAITGFAPVLVDLGTRDAVVQRPSITPREVSTLFWITVGVGLGLALVVGACGPVVARFYRESRLITIVLISSLTFVATALMCQHHALMRRAMMFKQLAIIDVGANVLSAGLAICLALQGSGYWALVIRPVATFSFTAVGVWCACRWLPGWPALTAGVRDMLKFGLHIAGFSMTDFLGRNCDRVAIGHSLGAIILGYYQNALFVYDNLLDVLVFPLHSVAVASLSKLRHDPGELKKSWGKALSTVAFYAMPAFGLLAVTGRDLIVLLLGSKWAAAGVLLSVLAFRGIPHSVERTLGWLHVAAGRTDRWMRWGVFATCVQLVALFVGLPFGQMGVVMAYAVCMYVLFIPAIAYAGRPLGIGAADVVRVVGRQLLGAIAAAGIGFFVWHMLPGDVLKAVRILLVALAYTATYVALVVGMLRVRTPLAVILSLGQGFMPKCITTLGKSGFLLETR